MAAPISKKRKVRSDAERNGNDGRTVYGMDGQRRKVKDGRKRTNEGFGRKKQSVKAADDSRNRETHLPCNTNPNAKTHMWRAWIDGRWKKRVKLTRKTVRTMRTCDLFHSGKRGFRLGNAKNANSR